MTPNQLETLREAGAFEDFVGFHFDWSDDPEAVYNTLKSGMLSLRDLPDFNWNDYCEGIDDES